MIGEGGFGNPKSRLLTR